MLKFIKNLLFLFIIGQVVFGCNQRQPDNRFQKSEQNDFSFGKKHKNHRKNTQRQNQVAISTEVPQKVFEVLEYIKANNSAPQGYVGGRRFGNFEHNLADKDNTGQRINYQEWDVNPKVKGQNRGAERLITGSDGKAWFTFDHYRSFVEVK